MHKEMIKKMIIGMDWIEESVSNFRDEKLFETVLGVMNGEFGEGYAQQKYFFQYSFDDEICEMNAWAETMEIDIPWEETSLASKREFDNVQMVTYGMNQMAIALGRLSAWIRLNPEVKKELLEKESEGGYNPFKLYGIVGFERLVRGWRQAYLKELKDALGRRKLADGKESVALKYFEVTGFEDEKGWKMVHNPVTMDEEEHRIQVLNEASATHFYPEWYEKKDLSLITEKEYENWYSQVYLTDVSKMKTENKVDARDLSDENLIRLLNIVVEHNEDQIEEADGDQNHAQNLIVFSDEESGQSIYNPFYDSTSRFEVDPIEEYGRENIVQMVNNYFGDKLSQMV